MKPKERVLRAINFQEPDRVPLYLGGDFASITPPAHINLRKHLSLEGDYQMIESFSCVHNIDEKILQTLDIDVRSIFLRAPQNWQSRINEDGSITTEWGINWKKFGLYKEFISTPLKDTTIDDLDLYPWPDPYDPGRIVGLRDEAINLYENSPYAVVAGLNVSGIWEYSFWMRSLEQLCIDMLTNKAYVHALVEKITELMIGFFKVLLREVGPYIHIIEWADDYGSQKDLIISLDLFREFFKPAVKKVIHYIKSHTDAKLLFHSCGSVVDVIEDLIEIGVDIINPLQPLAAGMDPKNLKEKFGGRVCFHGGIDEQRLLPFGSQEEVEAEVKKVIQILAPGGGYILAPAHNIQADTPCENVLTMYPAAKKFGTYPIIHY